MPSPSRDPETASRSSRGSYDAPRAYQNIDDVTAGLSVDIPPERQAPATEAAAAEEEAPSPVRERRRSSAAESPTYDIPEDWANLDEVAATSPVENIREAPIYRHHSLEEIRSRDERERRRASVSQTRLQPPPPTEQFDVEEAVETKEGGEEERHVSRLTTEIYTISYLVFFSIWGTLARVGLTALTTYPGVPVVFSVLWANFGGSLIMGFLSEDRMLFRYELGTPTYDQVLARTNQNGNGEGSSTQDDQPIDLAAAKKAHLATKKTIPLYIGLATGFCGSFTSFSSFIRDIFLALSNEMVTPKLGIPDRNGGYSFLALLAVTITTVCLSLSALILGAHLAIALERFTPSIPYPVTRRILDPLGVLLGWGCWLGAVLMAIFPPHNRWRGEILFALVFSPLGCLARFYLSIHLNAKIASFPLGTFTANVGGTAVLGMAWDIAHARVGGVAGCQVLQGIEDGFCGCLTTISTWVAELSSLERRHSYVYGFSSVAGALAVMIAIMGGLRWSDGFSPLACVA
ncbi:hypothetical protein CCMA1212_001552 [Trichoderma ghanense]|uniref:Chromosome condensation protein n=1 Tax=Trichoderma ghanense TaxID=65468 RepID=A0ABY2HBY9_9HYPO